jgi:nucleoside 2-deoxyribosyltransferase
MNIYFAGSIRGGRGDVSTYKELIGFLKQYGTVLTEHVGDYSLSIAGQNQLDDGYIHDRDVNWLSSCDVVVAEASTPSLGVGYELCFAEKLGIPVVVLRRSNANQLSAMISGMNNCSSFDYRTIDQAKSILKKEVDIIVKK